MLTEECLAHFQYVRAAKLAVYQQGEVELLPTWQPQDQGEEEPDKYSYNGTAMLEKIQPSGLLRQADGFHTLKHTHTHRHTHAVYGGMLLQDPPRSLPQWSFTLKTVLLSLTFSGSCVCEFDGV